MHTKAEYDTKQVLRQRKVTLGLRLTNKVVKFEVDVLTHYRKFF